MKTFILYKYKRPEGGTIVSPKRPDCEHIEMYRLVADEDKELVFNGVTKGRCADTKSLDGWSENYKDKDKQIADMREALTVLGVSE